MKQPWAESTQRLSEGLKAQAADVDGRAMAEPSKGIAGFRNVLVHDYMDGIDLKRVWDVVNNYLPELETAVRELFENFSRLSVDDGRCSWRLP
jgi:uncharacterized protein with HEPN domain